MFIVNVKQVEKLLSLCDKAHCYQVDRALSTGIELLSFIKSYFSTCEIKKWVKKIESNMENLFENLNPTQDAKFFMFLSMGWIKLVKNSLCGLRIILFIESNRD